MQPAVKPAAHFSRNNEIKLFWAVRKTIFHALSICKDFKNEVCNPIRKSITL